MWTDEHRALHSTDPGSQVDDTTTPSEDTPPEPDGTATDNPEVTTPAEQPVAEERAIASGAAALQSGESETGQNPGDATWSEQALPKDALFSNGAFTRSVAIKVPQFFQIAPKIALRYNSDLKLRSNESDQATLGVGFRLDGIPAIQRASADRGTPRFIATDIWTLDGEPLMPCADAPNAPSCAAGGTHTTRFEAYVRIKRLAAGSANETWEVTRKDGAVMSFSPVAKFAGSYTSPDAERLAKSYRFLLDTVKDTSDNTVKYNYNCDDNQDNIAYCPPYTITYGPYQVEFHYNVRPDTFTFATGTGLLTVKKRLTTVEVVSSGARQSAYRINYAAGGVDQVSRVASITRFGSNATISGGLVTGGAQLPPETYDGYTDTPPAWAERLPAQNTNLKYVIGDFTGDGRADYAIPNINVVENSGNYNGSCRLTARQSGTDDQTSLYVFVVQPTDGTYSSFKCRASSKETYRAADVDGDGRAELLRFVDYDSGLLNIYIFYFGTSSVTVSSIQNNVPDDIGIGTIAIGDIDGDGDDDVVLPERNKVLIGRPGSVLTNGDLKNTVAELCPAQPCKVLPLDAFGNGRADFLAIKQTTSTIWSWSADLNKFVANSSENMPGTPPQDVGGNAIADVNGDGLDDYVARLENDGASPSMRVYLNTGKGFAPLFMPIDGATTSRLNGLSMWVRGDFNGDGRDDLEMASDHTSSNPALPVTLLSTGAGFKARTGITRRGLGTADFNGDGVADIFAEDGQTSAADTKLYISSGVDSPPASGAIKQALPQNLLTSLEGPLGATIAVSYTSSADFDNDRLPFVFPVVSRIVTGDGRSQSPTDPANSTTSYAYSGGKWSVAERRFLGFRTLTASLPKAAGETVAPRLEATFSQALGAIGVPILVERLSDTTRLSSVKTTLTLVNTAPYSAVVASRDEVLGGPANPRGKTTSYSYDAYANVTSVTETGKPITAGDKRVRTTSYNRNTNAYIVNLPKQILYYKGEPDPDDLVPQTINFYDERTDIDALP